MKKRLASKRLDNRGWRAGEVVRPTSVRDCRPYRGGNLIFGGTTSRQQVRKGAYYE